MIKNIGVFAPSSYIEKEDIEKSTKLLTERGYNISVHPQTYARYHQSAGTIQEKLDAYYDLLQNPEIDVIWAAGGGNHASWLIDRINYNLIHQNPKPLIGFSDITALLTPLYAHTGLQGLHAQVFKHLHDFNANQLDQTLLCMNGQGYMMPCEQTIILSEGNAEGILIGGNLSVFQYLPSTLPDHFLKGTILFFEDFGEELSHFDRQLLFLKRTGVLEQANGIIFGEMNNMKDTGRPYGLEVTDIIKGHTDDLNIPVILDAPFGHGSNLWPIPYGDQGQLQAKPENTTIKIGS